VAKYAFLSDDWFTAVHEALNDHGELPPSPAGDMTANLVVSGTPWGDTVELHMGSTDGTPHFDKGHADGADLTLTTDYDTAKAVFISGDAAAGMQAFMQGKIKVQGDMTKLMAMQASGGGPAGDPELQKKLQEITE
jgi:putative sterol carrier protein